MKERLREALRSYGLWVGGNLATHQDMFALFWARGAERYLNASTLASSSCPMLPSTPPFAGMRDGSMSACRWRSPAAGAGTAWPIFGALRQQHDQHLRAVRGT